MIHVEKSRKTLFLRVFSKKQFFPKKKKVFRDIVKIHFVLIFHEDISKTAPCGRADTQTDTQKVANPYKEKKGKKERQRRQKKGRQRQRGGNFNSVTTGFTLKNEKNG